MGFIGLALCAAAAQAQEIEVVEDAGRAVGTGGRTPLEFRTSGGHEVGIHRILTTTTVSGYGYSGYGETTERLCSAAPTGPCRLEVPDGQYRVRVDDNFLFGRRLTIDAAGEPLAWEVRRSRPVGGIAGIVLTGVGLGGVTSGLLLGGLGDGSGGKLALASTPVSVGGLYLLLDAFARAKPVTPTAAAGR